MRDLYDPPKPWELNIAVAALRSMPRTEFNDVYDIAARIAFPSVNFPRERAVIVLEACLLPGGVPATRLGMIVAVFADKLSAAELLALVRRYNPSVTHYDICAELLRHLEARLTAH